MLKGNIFNQLNFLQGLKIQNIGRTLDMVNIGFGEPVVRKKKNGEEIIIGKFALHVQCPFRIIRDNNIVLGYTDIFIPDEENSLVVDLNKRNTNVFDSKVEWLKLELKNEVVKGVYLTSINDLVIQTTNFTIEILVCDQTSESWRFFCVTDDSPHIVVDEDGLRC